MDDSDGGPLDIRVATSDDTPALWPIIRAVVERGDTYTLAPDMPRDAALGYWLHPANRCYVALQDEAIVGTYILRANQPAQGGHVANAAFMVSPDARGGGIGRRMGEHALIEARRLGYRAMQFNFVVSTNEVALRLWRQLGFDVVGTLPGAFHHPTLGYVDAYVMFRSLVDDEVAARRVANREAH
jgi:GNAT superfamily N-acetyltransferase